MLIRRVPPLWKQVYNGGKVNWLQYIQQVPMLGSNFYDSLDDSLFNIELPSLIDFGSYQYQGDRHFQPPQLLNVISQPVSPVLFDRTDPPPAYALPHEMIPSMNNFAMGRMIPQMISFASPSIESPSLRPPKKAKRHTKIDTHKIKATTECCICLLGIKKNAKIPALECGHEFHKKCLLTWLNKKESCPLCRSDICCDP